MSRIMRNWILCCPESVFKVDDAYSSIVSPSGFVTTQYSFDPFGMDFMALKNSKITVGEGFTVENGSDASKWKKSFVLITPKPVPMKLQNTKR